MQKTTPILLKNTICSSGIQSHIKHWSSTFGKYAGRMLASDPSTPPLSVDIFMDKILCRKPRCTKATPYLQVFWGQEEDLNWEVHNSRVYRNCEVFPLSSSLFRHALCLCVTSWLWAECEEAVPEEDVSLLLWLLNSPAPGIWPCVVGTYYYAFCPKCICSSLKSQEPLSLLWV